MFVLSLLCVCVSITEGSLGGTKRPGETAATQQAALSAQGHGLSVCLSACIQGHVAELFQPH